MGRELKYTELRRFCGDLEQLAEACEYSGIIGQERGAASLAFGLGMKTRGYNIYVSGIPGTGKTTFALNYAAKIAEGEDVPPDLCYVYNFTDPKYPKLLQITGGMGKNFLQDMEELISLLSVEIKRIFAGREFEEQKTEIIKNYQSKRDDMIKEITEDAKAQNFGVKMTNTGIYFMPRVDGELIGEEQFDALPEEEKEKISKNSETIQERAGEVMAAIRDYDKFTRKEIEDLEYNTGLFVIGRHINRLMEKYGDLPCVLEYLHHVKEDLLESMEDFCDNGESEEEEYLQNMAPWLQKKNREDFISKYKVNLITDHAGAKGAPVIMGHNPTYANLVGEIEFDSEFGNFTTDFMKIKPGLLHKANGGYLVLQAHDVLTVPHAWETLKKSLKTGEIVIEPIREYSTGIAVASIRPENVSLHIKIIMVGSGLYSEILSEYDDDFQKLFKIKAVFDYELEYNQKNINEICGFIKKFMAEENTLPFDGTAAGKLIEYSTRLSESQNKLSSQFSKLWEILVEAAQWAKMEGAETVTGRHLEKAISERDYRHNIYEEKLGKLIEDNIVLIDTTGKKVGQINGLAVLETGDYVFGKPTRITATTYMGKSGIVNIEKEAELSGELHDKGVQIINGYLGQTYAQDFPLSLSCRICFEQNYNGINGDSASSTELYAILSSLSELPVNQELAVTGSINQRGEIQAIGGVTYKIEGFFDLCQKRGLTGSQGVIIPRQNVEDLSLKDNVVEAVKAGKFHIYAISHINEGLELLTGVPGGSLNEKGKYPADSVHGKVYKKLKDFYKKSLDL